MKAPGKYPLTLTAGEVYDTALSPVSLSARSGSVTVTEYAPVYSEFYLEMGLSDDTIAPGETVTAHVRNGWYMAFASCDLSVHYDATMFRLVDARVSGEIAGTVHSLNTDTPGLVRLSCATQTGCIYLREVTVPTCEAPGGEQLRCVSCGDLIPVSPLPPLGHDYGDAEFHWSDDYTACTATRVCARDEGHVWQVNCTVTHVSEGESCTQPGSVTYTATADFYGERFTDSQTVHKDMLGHDYAWTVLTEPGCTTEGLRRGECRRCGDTSREAVAPLGHDYHAQVTAPGCTEGGWTDHICNRCGDRVRDSFTDPVGHDWEGSSCSRCGAPRENPFTDVPNGSFFYNPVLWAVKNGVTSGATPTTFGPNAICNRAQVVTFLYRTFS